MACIWINLDCEKQKAWEIDDHLFAGSVFSTLWHSQKFEMARSTASEPKMIWSSPILCAIWCILMYISPFYQLFTMILFNWFFKDGSIPLPLPLLNPKLCHRYCHEWNFEWHQAEQDHKKICLILYCHHYLSSTIVYFYNFQIIQKNLFSMDLLCCTVFLCRCMYFRKA